MHYALSIYLMDLVLFGIQGSGKGTQAKRLAEEFGYDIFEAGGELRKIAASGSELGETVKSYIDAGNLVPHEIIMEVVAAAIAQRAADTKILFDGIPRDAAQKKDFDIIMQEAGREFTCVEILLDTEEAVRRIQQRAIEQGRADDADMAAIEKRMSIFGEKTRPVIDAYQQAGMLEQIDGLGSMEEVYTRLTELIQ